MEKLGRRHRRKGGTHGPGRSQSLAVLELNAMDCGLRDHGLEVSDIRTLLSHLLHRGAKKKKKNYLRTVK